MAAKNNLKRSIYYIKFKNKLINLKSIHFLIENINSLLYFTWFNHYVKQLFFYYTQNTEIYLIFVHMIMNINILF